jgi:hypothetical protein
MAVIPVGYMAKRVITRPDCRHFTGMLAAFVQWCGRSS